MTGTPLERQRAATADAGALAAIRERIEASGVECLYYQGVTISGRVIGKVVPARHLLRNAERGVQLHRTAAADLQTTREGQLLGGGAEAAAAEAAP
jgi:glutamine synthetase